MKRVLIIGSGGAGKSTLARRLGEKTGIEVIHLDALFWNPGWVRTEKAEWLEIVREVIEKESWIMDGNFGGTLEMRAEAADTIIFLDIPRWLCIYRIMKRWIMYRNVSRPDMAPGCPEKVDREFFMWVWDYPKRSKPEKERILKRYADEKTIIRLRSTREIEGFYEGID
jgi:adenylate kinase family enzyme